MSVAIMPNSGVLSDDHLDKLRGEALQATLGELPEEVVFYLRALEEAYIAAKHEQKKRSLREIGWKLPKGLTP